MSETAVDDVSGEGLSESDTDRQPLVDMRGITKTFGGVVACDQVDFAVRRGEVHALLGENGAGKSTLMNVLSGAFDSYEGEVLVAGRPIRLDRPAAAQAAGIGIIHQELDLVGSLSVAENLVLGREPRTWWRGFDRSRAVQQSVSALARLSMDVDPRRRVSELRIGEQQLVAIARALSTEARVLIMDEPTSALGQAETDRLFHVINALRSHGVGIVYISHRLEEVLSIADRLSILRDGRRVGTVEPAGTSSREIIAMMVGGGLAGRTDDAAADSPGQRSSTTDVPLLELRDLHARPRRAEAARTDPAGVSLTVHPGEIVGVAGLLGSGRTELLETIFGAGPRAQLTGGMWWQGEPVRFGSPRQAMAAGVCLVPEDRKAAGLFFHHSVANNLTLSALRRAATVGLVHRRRERPLADRTIRDLRIRTHKPSSLVGTLSGGNQQKVVIGRQLLTRPRLLLLDDPTRGVDVGAKAEIYRVLRGLASDGLGVLLASSELPELLGVCDRVVVLRHGRVVADRPTTGLTQEQILAAAQGEV